MNSLFSERVGAHRAVPAAQNDREILALRVDLFDDLLDQPRVGGAEEDDLGLGGELVQEVLQERPALEPETARPVVRATMPGGSAFQKESRPIVCIAR